MKAGELTERVQILRRQVVDDGLATAESWQPWGASRAARVRRTGGSEDQAGGVVQAVEMLQFRLRRDRTMQQVKTSDRIEWRGTAHVITGIAEDLAGRAWIEFQCSVRADL